MSAGTVVVGVDGSQAGLEAARWAGGEAERRDADLLVVHAYDMAGLYRDAAVAPLLDDVETTIRTEVDDVLERARAAAAQAAPEIAIETRWARGAPAPVLVEESGEALLVAIGATGRGTLGTVLGSVTLAVASHAACPVVVVRGEIDATGPVVVGVDGGPLSDTALAHAFAAASRHGAPLLAVHVWSDTDAQRAQLVTPASSPWESVRDAEERVLAERLAGWSQRYPDVAVERRIGQADPARALVEASAGARTVLVATRGRGGFAGLLLGSTGLSLVQHAPVPVTLVGPRSAVTP